MPRMPVVKTRNLVRVLEKLGFFKWHHVGSHAQYKHADGRRTTVAIHHGKDVKKKMLHGILADISVSAEEFKNLL